MLAPIPTLQKHTWQPRGVQILDLDLKLCMPMWNFVLTWRPFQPFWPEKPFLKTFICPFFPASIDEVDWLRGRLENLESTLRAALPGDAPILQAVLAQSFRTSETPSSDPASASGRPEDPLNPSVGVYASAGGGPEPSGVLSRDGSGPIPGAGSRLRRDSRDSERAGAAPGPASLLMSATSTATAAAAAAAAARQPSALVSYDGLPPGMSYPGSGGGGGTIVGGLMQSPPGGTYPPGAFSGPGAGPIRPGPPQLMPGRGPGPISATAGLVPRPPPPGVGGAPAAPRAFQVSPPRVFPPGAGGPVAGSGPPSPQGGGPLGVGPSGAGPQFSSPPRPAGIRPPAAAVRVASASDGGQGGPS